MSVIFDMQMFRFLSMKSIMQEEHYLCALESWHIDGIIDSRVEGQSFYSTIYDGIILPENCFSSRF